MKTAYLGLVCTSKPFGAPSAVERWLRRVYPYAKQSGDHSIESETDANADAVGSLAALGARWTP